tara:strand:- start:15 stop:146 length:132 start_codon:yes stop_codon:yes gene_type:complete
MITDLTNLYYLDMMVHDNRENECKTDVVIVIKEDTIEQLARRG